MFDRGRLVGGRLVGGRLVEIEAAAVAGRSVFLGWDSRIADEVVEIWQMWN